MISLNADQIKDFQTCELLFDYKYQQKLDHYIHPRFIKQQEFEDTIKKVVSFFFYKKQGSVEPSYQALLHRWEKLWFPKGTTALDLATTRHEIAWQNETSYTTQAAAALMKFYDEFSGKPLDEVHLLNESFEVPLPGGNRINGSFDLVVRHSKDSFTIYKWSGYHKRPPENFWSLDFAMLNYAFRYRNDWRSLRARLCLYDFGSSKPGPMYTRIADADTNAMIYWVDDAATTDVFVPRRGLTSHCRSCEFDKPCSEFKFPEVGIHVR